MCPSSWSALFLDEARELAKDAISGYIASLRKHKDPIPSDDKTLN
jgi:predicted RNase H-like HicB family nuclease